MCTQRIGADTKVSKFFINCLAEEPDDVASFLVPRIRKVGTLLHARVQQETCVPGSQSLNDMRACRYRKNADLARLGAELT